MIMKVTTFNLKGNFLDVEDLDHTSLTTHLEGYLLDWNIIILPGLGMCSNQGTVALPQEDIDHPA